MATRDDFLDAFNAGHAKRTDLAVAGVPIGQYVPVLGQNDRVMYRLEMVLARIAPRVRSIQLSQYAE